MRGQHEAHYQSLWEFDTNVYIVFCLVLSCIHSDSNDACSLYLLKSYYIIFLIIRVIAMIQNCINVI